MQKVAIFQLRTLVVLGVTHEINIFVVRLDAGARQGAAATAAATARSRGPTRETVAQTAAAAALAAAAGGGPPPVPAAAAAMASRMPAAAWPAIGATAPTMIRAGADGASSGAAGRTAAVQTMTGAARMVVRTPGQVTPWSVQATSSATGTIFS